MTESILIHYLIAWSSLAYIVIFLGMIVEGDAFVFATAFLAHQGAFEPIPAFIVLLAGVLVGDVLWYEFGKRAKNSSFFFVRWANRMTAPFDAHLRERTFRTLLVSKFLYGFHHPTLMRAGNLGLSLENLMRKDLVATCGWIVVVGGLGYVFSASLALVKHYLHLTEIALVAGVLGFFALKWIASFFLKREL